MRTPYDELGLPEDATDEAVIARFRELAKALHPDVARGAGGGDERFKRMTDAYNRLKTKDGRTRVDRELREGRERAEALRASIEKLKKSRSERRQRRTREPRPPIAAQMETPFINHSAKFARSRPPSERLWWIIGGTLLEVFRVSSAETRPRKRRGPIRFPRQGGGDKGTRR